MEGKGGYGYCQLAVQQPRRLGFQELGAAGVKSGLPGAGGGTGGRAGQASRGRGRGRGRRLEGGASCHLEYAYCQHCYTSLSRTC